MSFSPGDRRALHGFEQERNLLENEYWVWRISKSHRHRAVTGSAFLLLAERE